MERDGKIITIAWTVKAAEALNKPRTIELERWRTTTLQDFCQGKDRRLSLDPGGTLLLVRHLLATRIW